MATYEDELLGAPASTSVGKDLVLQNPLVGTIDVYAETLVGGVDYVVGAFGASNGGTLPDPGVVIVNDSLEIVAVQLDGGLIGFGGKDPLFNFRAPGLGTGQTDTYYIGVFDETGSGGEYTLSVEPAGPPVFF